MRISSPYSLKMPPHVLWRNINTAEQFKTGGVTDKKGRREATLPQLHERHCDSPLSRQAASPSLHMLHQSWNHTHVGRMKPGHTTKTKFNDDCLASVLSSFQNHLKQNKKKERKKQGIWKYTTLSWWWVLFRGPLQNVEVRFTGCCHVMEQRDPWSGPLSVWLLVL